jgi:hypothetical protein
VPMCACRAVPLSLAPALPLLLLLESTEVTDSSDTYAADVSDVLAPGYLLLLVLLLLLLLRWRALCSWCADLAQARGWTAVQDAQSAHLLSVNGSNRGRALRAACGSGAVGSGALAAPRGIESGIVSSTGAATERNAMRADAVTKVPGSRCCCCGKDAQCSASDAQACRCWRMGCSAAPCAAAVPKSLCCPPATPLSCFDRPGVARATSESRR